MPDPRHPFASFLFGKRVHEPVIPQTPNLGHHIWRVVAFPYHMMCGCLFVVEGGWRMSRIHLNTSPRDRPRP